MDTNNDSSSETSTDTSSSDEENGQRNAAQLSTSTIGVTRSAVLNFLRNRSMQRDAKLQIVNETLDEPTAKMMMSRFRVRTQGRCANQQRNLTRQFRARHYWRRTNREQIGARLLPREYIGQVKLKSRVFSSLWVIYSSF